jgi:hypothetical protein
MRSITLAAALVVFTTALPHRALAYEFLHSPSGANIHLPVREMTFRLPARLPDGLSAEEVQSAVEAALAVWSKASGIALRWEPGDPNAVQGYRTAGGIHNDIIFVEKWTRTAGAVAETVVSVDANTSQIRDADILFNLEEYKFRALSAGQTGGGIYYDFQEVLTHELGHALGLGHSQESEAVMYGQGYIGDTARRVLRDDDVEGVQALYASVPDSQESAVGCSSATRGSGLAGLVGCLALFLRPGRSTRRSRG